MADIDAATEMDLLNDNGAAGIEEKIHINDESLLDDIPETNGESKENKGSAIETAKAVEATRSDEADLFDEAIAPSSNASESRTDTKTASHASTSNSAHSTEKKFCCYVGNMTWWTTDADILLHISNLGITEKFEAKFFENRLTGQSKGYCLCMFNSDSCVKLVTEKLPQTPIHGSTLCVMPYTKASLAKLEESAAKSQTRPDPKGPKKVGGITEDGCVNMGTIRIGAAGPTPLMGRNMGAHSSMMMASRPPAGPLGGPTPLGGPSLMMGGPPNPLPPNIIRNPVPLVLPPGAPRPLMGGAPQPLMGTPFGQGPPGMGMRPGMPFQGGPQPLMRPGMPPPGAHVNPQVFPGMQGPPVSDAEFEEIMNRNRTVSSSAISRALDDAAAGEYNAAVETLLTAINLIRQSRVSHDDRCRMLVGTLQDTLTGIEQRANSSGSRGGRSKHRDRDRSRSRSRDRDRKRRRHSRSDSRSRSRSPRHRSHRY